MRRRSNVPSLVSSGTTRGELPFVPRSALIASELAGQVTQLAALAPNRLRPGAREPREGSMTLQISQRGKEYLKTAQTLLRAAQTMTDERLRVSLRPLPTTTSAELRKLRMLMRPTHSLDRLLTLKARGVHDLMGSFTAQPAE